MSAGESAPTADDTLGALRLEEVSYDHPEAARLTDLAQAYYLALYGGADTNPLAAAELAPPLGAFLVGYLGSEAVAMGGWHFSSGPIGVAAERPAEIRRMFVVANCRGQGLGWALLRAIEASAVAAGADVMVLETGLPQADAVGFYRSAGYRDVPAFGYWAEAPLAIHLGKRLTGTPNHGAARW